MIKISHGTVHKIPDDFQKILLAHSKIALIWETLTPLARNEWICWITSAKKVETRERRIRIALENLEVEKRRPCCWAGCGHR